MMAQVQAMMYCTRQQLDAYFRRSNAFPSRSLMIQRWKGPSEGTEMQ
jgi:hypothetical protein